MKYKIKYFKDTRMLVCKVGEVECLASTLLGLIETVEAYKASLNK
jgi:hypothetical protein